MTVVLRDAIRCMVFRRRLQQVIAVAMRQDRHSVLTVDKETTPPPQLASSHFQQLNCRIGRKDEVLVRLHEHKNDDEGSADDHSVRCERNGCRSEHGSQVYPAANRRRQLANALVFNEIKEISI